MSPEEKQKILEQFIDLIKINYCEENHQVECELVDLRCLAENFDILVLEFLQ
jgi:hypothetical protein